MIKEKIPGEIIRCGKIDINSDESVFCKKLVGKENCTIIFLTRWTCIFRRDSGAVVQRSQHSQCTQRVCIRTKIRTYGSHTCDGSLHGSGIPFDKININRFVLFYDPESPTLDPERYFKEGKLGWSSADD